LGFHAFIPAPMGEIWHERVDLHAKFLFPRSPPLVPGAKNIKIIPSNLNMALCTAHIAASNDSFTDLIIIVYMFHW